MCFGRFFKTKKTTGSATPSPTNLTTALLYDVNTLPLENAVLKRENEMNNSQVKHLEVELEQQKGADQSIDWGVQRRAEATLREPEEEDEKGDEEGKGAGSNEIDEEQRCVACGGYVAFADARSSSIESAQVSKKFRALILANNWHKVLGSTQ